VGGCGLGRRCDASGVLGERLPGCEVGWLLRSVEVGSGSAAAAGGCCGRLPGCRDPAAVIGGADFFLAYLLTPLRIQVYPCKCERARARYRGKVMFGIPINEHEYVVTIVFKTTQELSDDQQGEILGAAYTQVVEPPDSDDLIESHAIHTFDVRCAVRKLI
jgi:hypothetical protein